MTSRLGAASLTLLVTALLGLAGCSSDNNNGPAPTPTPTPVPCPLGPPFCGGDFPLNTVATTPYGPAWADVVTSPSDFLPCFGPYALCYYADCTVAPDGTVSDCPCFEWFGTSYVMVNGILNLDSYTATTEQCDADPDSCSVPNGAPVCADINNGTFLSGATRISTFSFYRAKEEPIGATDCADQPGLYAGCMTGPCAGPVVVDPESHTASISCECPLYDGPFQIGKDDQTCDNTPKAWSAGYNPTSKPVDPCDMINGCVVDAPTDSCGCPLFNSGTTLPPDSGVDCDTVCQEYNTCLRGNDLQLGYTCDATLCTSTDHDLVFDACLGLQNCDLSEIFKAEQAAECSCCGSQLCHCSPNDATNAKIAQLDQGQRDAGETPQCDINGTLCGSVP